MNGLTVFSVSMINHKLLERELSRLSFMQFTIWYLSHDQPQNQWRMGHDKLCPSPPPAGGIFPLLWDKSKKWVLMGDFHIIPYLGDLLALDVLYF